MTDPFIILFPRLATVKYRVTSPATDRYNCIAWAAARDDRWWEPYPDAFWPPDAPAEYTLNAYAAAYATLGYERCVTGDLEPQFEKIVLFADANGFPTHAARQLDTGRWTSKLGRDVDIEHPSPDDLNGQQYGTSAFFMRRPRPLWRWPRAWLHRARIFVRYSLKAWRGQFLLAEHAPASV